ncbi:hypothetical protein Cfor_06137 [Coptotermes formosanus]|uniref:Protein krueppel n=1 Tax=Coptotermes formosanus TaxID=36987 RepID=A0A6L2PCH1_COPFO|nr:hypothetical protein Cfor_06137 [Coptotermes formosanus]
MAPCEKSIADFCRLCAVEAKNGVVIYSSEGVNLCLEEKIIQCLRIEVSKDDMLPKKVCRPCRARLEDYHKFAERANRVQHTLELLIQMKSANMSSGPLVAETKNEDGIHVKKDPDDIEIKDELMELPLDVTLVSDGDSHVDTKVNSTDDDHSIPELPPLPHIRESKHGSINERPMRLTRRRKMLQPKKSSRQQPVVARRRGRSRRNIPRPPPSSEEDSEEEVKEEKIDEEGDEDPEELEKTDPDEIDELNVFKGLRDEEEEEEDEEIDDEADKNAKEEWKTHWGIKCNQCEQIFPFKSQFDRHYRSLYERKPIYTCSYCNKTMEKYSTFRSHCYRHVTEGRYRCEYCQKGFSLRSMLHVHILAKHTTVKPFICEECGKGFVTRPGLNIHLKKHKTDEKLEYPCGDCGKVLHTRGGLTAHQNVHKLGRRFMCDVCGKTFTQKVNMQQHVKHHTGERPFACEKCGKCFAEKSHLNRHYSFHSEKRPFQCTICLKMYKTERCLKVHAMVHAEARPYVCTYCNKGFLSTTKLKQHYNIHTGERPYACKFCERTFTNYPNWLKHTRRRHKTDPRGGIGASRVVVQSQEGNHQGLIPLQQLEEVPQEDERGSVSCHTPQSQQPSGQVIPVACLTNNANPSTGSGMGLMTSYPHQSQQPHPAHQTHHQSMTSESRMHTSIPLTQVQVYPEHMMAIPITHHHHMLPL